MIAKAAGNRNAHVFTESEPAPTRNRVTSKELFEGSTELVIEHDGKLYVLRAYDSGTLSLHKQHDAPRRRVRAVTLRR